MKVDAAFVLEDLRGPLARFWALSGDKIALIERDYDASKGSPVFTVGGKYTTRGWTEWTQGFQYGASVLQFDATDEERFLKIAREGTLQYMAPHVSHTGVHDHGFNNTSTYGGLLRLLGEGRIPANEWEANFYRLALKISGAVQAGRWSRTADGQGYIYSFNGPHSLFADTIRSLRALALSYRLGHVMMGENDKAVSLLERLVMHARTTADYAVFYGEGRDAYDVRAVLRMRVSLTRMTAITGVRIRSRGMLRSARGRGVWPGLCVVMPRNWSFWIRWHPRSWHHLAVPNPSGTS
jgi:unsaturated chondroitin disaccharide hydrolase